MRKQQHMMFIDTKAVHKLKQETAECNLEEKKHVSCIVKKDVNYWRLYKKSWMRVTEHNKNYTFFVV